MKENPFYFIRRRNSAGNPLGHPVETTGRRRQPTPVETNNDSPNRQENST